MMFTFKQFIEHNNFVCSLFEQDAAPPGSVPAAPQNPDNKTTNNYHLDFLQRQLDIDDDSLKAALEGNAMPVFQVPDYSRSWGFLVTKPCTATVEERPDGNFNITFQLDKLGRKSFIKPYQKGENPEAYMGEIENKTEIITREELQNILVKPYASMAGGAGAPPSMPPGGPPL